MAEKQPQIKETVMAADQQVTASVMCRLTICKPKLASTNKLVFSYLWEYVSVNFVSAFHVAAIHENGQGIADVDLEGVHTNIVMVKMVKSGLTPAEFCSRLAQVKFLIIV